MDGDQVFSHLEVGLRVLQLHGNPAGLPAAERLVIKGLLALLHVVAQHLDTVDPDDRPVVEVLVQDQGVGDLGGGLDGEGVPHVDGGVGVAHVRQLRIVIIVAEADGGLTVEPALIEGKACLAPPGGRIGGFRGSQAVTP